MKIPRILVVNDDGIHAPGIAVLERIARDLADDVWVVAPDFERSGASRAVSLAEPVRIRQIDERHYSVLRGTPADCVATALSAIMRDYPPALVLSGINRGANLAEELTYSGTVAAAMEAAGAGVRSIAMSQILRRGEPARWQVPERHAATLVRALWGAPSVRGVFHNVNFPDCAPSEVRGVRATRQGQWGRIQLTARERIDPRNFPYQWLSFELDPGEQLDLDTDVGAIVANWISVTPVHADLTHQHSLQALGRQVAGIKLS